MVIIFKHLERLAHSCNAAGYSCIRPAGAFVKAVTGALSRRRDYGAVPSKKSRDRQIQQSIGRVTMLSPNKQLAAEVMTVIILGSATFLAMSSERPADSALRQTGMIAVSVQNSPELPQELVRDYTFGS
jgi:hypothetical protein